jgi:hypothetical protein
MLIQFIFDTDSENFDYIELRRYKCVDDMAMCIGAIADKVRYWYNKDNRNEISTDEIGDVIFGIINEHINLEKIGY